VESHRPPKPTYGTIRFVTPSQTTLQEESGTPIVVEIARDGDLTQRASVDLGEIGITAQADTDFTRAATRLVFEPNEERKSVSVGAINDEEYDKDEEFQLVLRYPIGAAVSNDTLTFKISDTDLDRGKAQFALANLSVWESAGTLQLEVKRVGTLTNSLTVNFETYTLGAVAGTDYQAVAGQLEFQPGQASRTIPVTVMNDALFQGYLSYREFGVRLTGSNLASPTTMRVAIFNDDFRSGRAVMSKQLVDVSENAIQAVLRVSRTDGSEGDLTVQFRTEGGTAQPGTDFAATSGTITFSNEVMTLPVVIDIYDNNLFDANRELRVIVTNPDQTTSESVIRIANDDPDRGKARFTNATVAAREADGSVTLDVTREGVSDGILSVLYSTGPLSAVPGRDYSTAVGKLDFAAGETSKQIQIPILADQQQEAAESFRVTLYGDVTTPDTVMVEIAADAVASRANRVTATSTGEKRAGGRIDIVLLALLAATLVMNRFRRHRLAGRLHPRVSHL